jgi:hypothetical protein
MVIQENGAGQIVESVDSTSSQQNNMSVLSLVGSAFGPVGGAVGGVLDSIFGGGSHEDTSVTGFNNFVQSRGSVAGVQFPSKAQLIQVGTAAGWAADDLAAISSNYDQSTGTFSKGDWHGVVINTSPTTIKMFKGASESFLMVAAALAFSNQSANNIAEGESLRASDAQKAAFGGTGQVSQGGGGMMSGGSTSSFGSPIVWIVSGVGLLITILFLMFKRKR